jgi:homoserine dehydrogenase
LSGTCGLILDFISRCGCSLRTAAEKAFDLGITEPRISADLSGQDVLDKLRLVAFAMGCELADEDVKLTPLVPHSVLLDDNPGKDDHQPSSTQMRRQRMQTVFEALEAYDVRERFVERASESYKAGRRWRFLAKLELGRSKAKARIGLSEVDEEHYAFPSRGQEIVFALWDDEANTKGTGNPQNGDSAARRASMPIVVVRGQAAGTAAGEGVLGDVVKLVDI